MIEWASGDVTSLFQLREAQRLAAAPSMAQEGALPLPINPTHRPGCFRSPLTTFLALPMVQKGSFPLRWDLGLKKGCFPPNLGYGFLKGCSPPRTPQTPKPLRSLILYQEPRPARPISRNSARCEFI